MTGVLTVCTAVYALGVLWFAAGALRRGARRGAAPTERPPTVAVVLAARDEAGHVGAVLESLGRQTYPADRYEVVLVDDGSSDGTGGIARAVARRLQAGGRRVRVVDGPAAYGASGSKKAALALAIAATDSDIILTTDADCDVPVGWVEALAGAFAADVGAVIGFSQIGSPGRTRGALAAWEGLDFLQLLTAAAGSCAHGHPMAATGQSLGFRRQAFVEVGGYDSVRRRLSGDDVLLLQLIRRSGRWRIAFCGDPAARVVHPPSAGLGSFLRRRARWASNAPLQARLDPLFFGYMVATFCSSAALAAGPALWAGDLLPAPALAALWGGKGAAELALALVGARRFGRVDLLRAFPAWVLLHPYYATLTGLVGPLGFFRWKGRAAAFGNKPHLHRGLPAGR